MVINFNNKIMHLKSTVALYSSSLASKKKSHLFYSPKSNLVCYSKIARPYSVESEDVIEDCRSYQVDAVL